MDTSQWFFSRKNINPSSFKLSVRGSLAWNVTTILLMDHDIYIGFGIFQVVLDLVPLNIMTIPTIPIESNMPAISLDSIYIKHGWYLNTIPRYTCGRYCQLGNYALLISIYQVFFCFSSVPWGRTTTCSGCASARLSTSNVAGWFCKSQKIRSCLWLKNISGSFETCVQIKELGRGPFKHLDHQGDFDPYFLAKLRKETLWPPREKAM